MSKILYSKVSLTYQAQLQQLKDRGLIIENDEKAFHLLEKINYYGSGSKVVEQSSGK